MQSALLLMMLLLRASRALVTPAARRSRSSARYASAQRVVLRALTSDGENVHAAWTREDDWKLWQHRDDADVAELLGRKAGGVAARLKKLEDPASTAAKRLFGEEQEETIDMEDYLALDDDALLRQCRVDYRRDSGTCSASTPF